MAATGILWVVSGRVLMLVLSSPRLPHRAIVEIVWRASVGVRFKVRLDCVAVECAFVLDLWSSMGVVQYFGRQWPVSRRGRVLAWARTAFAGRARRERD
jgi:hypothetical protein